MITFNKNDFDENAEDIINSINRMLNSKVEKDKEHKEEENRREF